MYGILPEAKKINIIERYRILMDEVAMFLFKEKNRKNSWTILRYHVIATKI